MVALFVLVHHEVGVHRSSFWGLFGLEDAVERFDRVWEIIIVGYELSVGFGNLVKSCVCTMSISTDFIEMGEPSCLLVEMGWSTLAREIKRFLDFAFIARSSMISLPWEPLASKVLIKQFILLLTKHQPTIFGMILLHRQQLSSTTRVPEVLHLQLWIHSLNIYIDQLF